MHGERNKKPRDIGKPARASEIESLQLIVCMGDFFVANSLVFCLSKKRKIGNGMKELGFLDS